VQRSIELTEQRYCGVSAMLEKGARIVHTFTINERSEPSPAI
jgi:uncharacterized OsmC-like protein